MITAALVQAIPARHRLPIFSISIARGIATGIVPLKDAHYQAQGTIP
jgi:hypothetical protein